MKASNYMIGLMSGTSVDGLDVAFCRFGKGNDFDLLAAKTYPYNDEIKALLKENLRLAPAELFELDAILGYFYGATVNQFRREFKLPKPLAIASHGHTVYHNPAKNFTVQIGKGSHIAAVAGLPVVCDFRSTDVALGGQGAPLVPIGDAQLFGEYDYCLNLGGIANVSYKKGGKRLAYDISACNLPVNILMQQMGKEFDADGETGAQGTVLPDLLQQLNDLKYYQRAAPKSMGREWIEAELMPLLNKHKNTANVLRTYYEHISIKIGEVLNKKGGTVLVTGGGAHNTFLMRLIVQQSKSMVVTPQPELIDFKEALVFAFLGYQRIYHQKNALKSVTGAMRDSVGGCIYLP